MKQVADYCINYDNYNAFYNEDESHDHFCCITNSSGKLYSTKIQGRLKKAYATQKNRKWICLVFEFPQTDPETGRKHTATLFLDPENRNAFRLLMALQPYKQKLLGKRLSIRTNKSGLVAVIDNRTISLNENFNIGRPGFERAVQMLSGLVLIPERMKEESPDEYTKEDITYLLGQQAKAENKNARQLLIEIVLCYFLECYGPDIRKNGLDPTRKEDVMTYFKQVNP